MRRTTQKIKLVSAAKKEEYNMKKLVIYDPAMCCSTGVCGPSIDPNLLRISTVLNNIKKNNVIVERYNLSQEPQAYLINKEVSELLKDGGVEVLPITFIDDVIMKTKEYPTNEELSKWLDIPESKLTTAKFSLKDKVNNIKGCC